VFAYPYARTRETLEHLRRNGEPHPAHGHKMQFINPATGGYAMPTIGAFVQLLPAGFTGKGWRGTDATVFHVIEGRGSARIAGIDYAFGARDTFVVPSWHTCSLSATADTVLFSFSDRPVQRAVGLWREETLSA
jgi:gentisate 1,2-dioxygenase